MSNSSIPLDLQLARDAVVKLVLRLDGCVGDGDPNAARERLPSGADVLRDLIEDAARAVAPVEGELLEASGAVTSAHWSVISFGRSFLASIPELSKASTDGIQRWLATGRLKVDVFWCGIIPEKLKHHRVSAGIDHELYRAAALRLSRGRPAERIPQRTTMESTVEPPKQPHRFHPLSGWSAIIAALNETLGEDPLRNIERTRALIRKLNTEHGGPIVLPEGRGKQPQVDNYLLLEWWSPLQEHYDRRVAEAEQESESAKCTVVDTHTFSRTGKVVPGIHGYVKPRKTPK
jgi:hypothetical protein